jgi:hypothetical protein
LKCDRNHIYHHLISLNCSADEIFYRLFQCNGEKISLQYLRKLCSRLLKDPLFAQAYIGGSGKRTGRKRILNRAELVVIPKIALSMQHTTIKKMKREFTTMFYENQNVNHLSISTFRRTLSKATDGIKLK